MAFYEAGTVDENNNPINFHYQLAQFNDIGQTQLYQEIDANGEVLRFTDMLGHTVTQLPSTEYFIANTFPVRPSWGT